ncbi:MAG: TlpA disulfide reductase family protein [Planctomycetota bacterium]
MKINLRRCLAAISGGIVTVSMMSASAAPPSPEAALGLKPIQKDVEYQQVDADDVGSCEVRDIERGDWAGWEVMSPDGLVLRRFADTNNDKKVDLWCYFQYGVETYRDIDSNFNGKADQYRWMATAGTRHGIDSNEDGRIDTWKMISAEEATAELVQALATKDANRFAALLASGRELRAIGLSGDRYDRLVKKVERAAGKFRDFATTQTAIQTGAQWLQFASPRPGVIAEGEPGVEKDIIAYENAVAMFESGGKSSQLLVGTLIRIGETWKMVDLPVLATDGQPIAQSSGNFFTPGSGTGGDSIANSTADAATQALVSDLETIDGQLAQTSDPKKLSILNERRADVVEKLVAEAKTNSDRDTWVRQLVDTVSVATQSGAYPGGLKRLQALAKSLRGKDASLRAYAEFQLISTEYLARQSPDANFGEIQTWYLQQLNSFADRFPRAPESAQAKLQLGLSKEFEDKEKDALKFYKEVVRDFSGTPSAEKALGAVRRLESVGKTIELSGLTVDGKSVRLSQFRGRPVVLHYWATWCEPCKQDMKLLRSLQARYQRAGLQLVGVNIDNRREQAAEFLKGVSLPWPQLFAEGGLDDSPLAKQFGVQTLPTMMLVDARGRVVRHNVRAAELDEELQKLTKKR